MNKFKRLFAVFLILWFIASLITTLTPSHKIPFDSIFGYDKLLHIIKFFFFSIILYNFLHYSNWSYKVKLSIFIPLQFYPLIDEALQIFVPSRSFSAYDILANYVGVLIGILVSIIIRITIHKKRVLLWN